MVFSKTKKQRKMPNIHNAVLIGSSIEKVYESITSSEGLSAWWTPNAKTTVEINSVASFPFGNDYIKEMKITELKPFESVKWACIKGTDEWIGTNISFKLLTADKKTLLDLYPDISGQVEQLTTDQGTLLIFNHNDWKEYTLMFAECSYTWGQFLKSLKLYCETGKGKPYPNQHY
jgi:uncharacterized protein YndB with AHSA1/START domain